eukprot:TRINITY_DN42478_c0_g1_i1.p1 TRINITY_DN42478_c0_g1~~TRINITY_DN42478_c0_g1_i1.p1  ORF type:complete len:228 (-),score=29.08 TRINITY_DN42478_c0_g1_i1:215-898(-)
MTSAGYSKGLRKGGGKGKNSGKAAWLLGLDTDCAGPVETQAASANAYATSSSLETNHAESVKNEAATASPRGTSSAHPTEGPQTDKAEASSSTDIQKDENLQIMCEVDPDEILAWRELFFKVMDSEDDPEKEVVTGAATCSHGTWGQQGSMAKLLKQEGLQIPYCAPEPSSLPSSSSQHTNSSQSASSNTAEGMPQDHTRWLLGPSRRPGAPWSGPASAARSRRGAS